MLHVVNFLLVLRMSYFKMLCACHLIMFVADKLQDFIHMSTTDVVSAQSGFEVAA